MFQQIFNHDVDYEHKQNDQVFFISNFENNENMEDL